MFDNFLVCLKNATHCCLSMPFENCADMALFLFQHISEFIFFFFVMSHFLLISLNFITLSIFNNISLLFFFTCSCVDFWVFRFVFCLSLLHSLIRDIILLFTVFYIIFVIPLSLTYIIDFYITWNLVMFSPWPY